jgi:hypothetical protein
MHRNVFKKATLWGAWTAVPNSCCMQHMAQLTDSSFLGLSTNGTLYYKPTLDDPFVAYRNLDPKFIVKSIAVPGAGGQGRGWLSGAWWLCTDETTPGLAGTCLQSGLGHVDLSRAVHQGVVDCRAFLQRKLRPPLPLPRPQQSSSPRRRRSKLGRRPHPLASFPRRCVSWAVACGACRLG